MSAQSVPEGMDAEEHIFYTDLIQSRVKASVFLVSGIKLVGAVLVHGKTYIIMMTERGDPKRGKDTENSRMLIYKSGILSVTRSPGATNTS